MKKLHCNGCGSFDIHKISSIRGEKYSSGDSFDLFCCNDCGLVFIDIETDGNFINKYYPENYKPHNQRLIRTSNFRKTLMQAIRNFVFRKEGTRSSIVLATIKQIIFYLYNKAAYRSIPFYRSEGKLLDIGCGTGDYLLSLQDIGWSVHGVEPVEKAAFLAKKSGLFVECKSYEEVEYPEKYFDVITMWHVLEHFPDPKKVLQKASKMLKDDGLLLVGVPNYDSLDRNIFKEYWNGFEIPLHLYHFTPVSINTLTKLTGLTCKKIIHTIRPSDMVSSLTNYLENRYKIAENRLIKKLLLLISIPISLFSSLLKRSSIIVVHIEKQDH